MSIHDARPGPEWYWIYDKNREKWIDRRKYTFDKVTNTFVADYSYRLKWIQWILLLLITAAIIVGIIFGVKSANSKDDNKQIPTELTVEGGYKFDYMGDYVNGYGRTNITPAKLEWEKYIEPIDTPIDLKNGEEYTFTAVARDAWTFPGGFREIEITVSLQGQTIFRSFPDLKDILNPNPIGVTDQGDYKPANTTYQPGLFHDETSNIWKIHPPAGWALNSCDTTGSKTWMTVDGNTDPITKDSNGNELKIVKCDSSNTQVEFVNEEYRYVKEEIFSMNKPLKFITIVPVKKIPDQTQSFLNMNLPADEAKMGNDLLQSMNGLIDRGLIDRSLATWVFLGLSGLKTESYHFNGVDPNLKILLNDKTEEKITEFYEKEITLNTSQERIKTELWSNGERPNQKWCDTVSIDDNYWTNVSGLLNTPPTEFRRLFATDFEETTSNLNTIRVFQKDKPADTANHFHYFTARAVDSLPTGPMKDNYKYQFYSHDHKDEIYEFSGTNTWTKIDTTPDSFWLCQIRSRPNSVIIPAFWPNAYKKDGAFGIKEERYTDLIWSKKLDKPDEIIKAVKAISDDKGGSYFPYVSNDWKGNQIKSAEQLKTESIISLIHWLYPAVLLNQKTVPTYEEFNKYINNPSENQWTKGMKDTFNEISTASKAVVTSIPATRIATGSTIKSVNVTQAEFDKIWAPFEKLWFNLVHPTSTYAHAFPKNDLKTLVYTGKYNTYNWGIVNNKDELGPIGRINALLNTLISQDPKQMDRFLPLKTGTKNTSIFAPGEGFIEISKITPIELGLIQIKFEKNVVDFSSNTHYNSLLSNQWKNISSSEKQTVFNFLNSMRNKDKSELIYYLPWNTHSSAHNWAPGGFLNYLSRSLFEVKGTPLASATSAGSQVYDALLNNWIYTTSLKDAAYSEFEKHDVVASINTLLLAMLHNDWTLPTVNEVLYSNIMVRDDSGTGASTYKAITSFDAFITRILAFINGNVDSTMVGGGTGEYNNSNYLPKPYNIWPAPMGTTTWP